MKKDTSKTTILVISTGFIVVYLVFAFKWALYTSLIIGLIGIASARASRKIEWLWLKLSYVLSKIVPTLLLSVIFFLVLFPVSLVSKLFTKDPLMLLNRYDSYFTEVKNPFTRKSMEQTW